MTSLQYVVVDIETTGLSKSHHHITEIAAVKVCNGHIVKKFQSLVNPGVKIPRFITQLTGIDNTLLADADPIDKVLPQFLDFVGDDIIIAHNATFDYGFLSHNVDRYLGIQFCNHRLCTRKLAHRLLPQLYSKRLDVVCEHFEIVNDHAHRAMTDAMATFAVFENFLSMMSEKGITNIQDVMDFERRPRKRIS